MSLEPLAASAEPWLKASRALAPLSPCGEERFRLSKVRLAHSVANRQLL